MALDCVIPAHEKDFETLRLTVASIRRCCPEVRRIVVVASKPYESAVGEGAAEFLAEDADCWPFRRADLEGCGGPVGWLLQQLLKLYALLVIPDLAPVVLVCDADVVWLPEGGVRFLQPAGCDGGAVGGAEGSTSAAAALAARICSFSSEGCPPIRSAVDLRRYDGFVGSVLPGLAKRRPGGETAVCHHMCLQRDIVEDLIARVEASSSGRPFWAVFCDAARRCEGRASEYELYHAFACRFFSDRIVDWSPAFAVTADAEAALRSPPRGVTFVVAHSHLRGLSREELADREGIINGDVQAEVLRRMTQGQPPELLAALAASGML